MAEAGFESRPAGTEVNPMPSALYPRAPLGELHSMFIRPSGLLFSRGGPTPHHLSRCLSENCSWLSPTIPSPALPSYTIVGRSVLFPGHWAVRSPYDSSAFSFRDFMVTATCAALGSGFLSPPMPPSGFHTQSMHGNVYFNLPFLES